MKNPRLTPNFKAVADKDKVEQRGRDVYVHLNPHQAEVHKNCYYAENSTNDKVVDVYHRVNE